eukprot:7382141-Prymnesium_polylepis.1
MHPAAPPYLAPTDRQTAVSPSAPPHRLDLGRRNRAARKLSARCPQFGRNPPTGGPYPGAACGPAQPLSPEGSALGRRRGRSFAATICGR